MEERLSFPLCLLTLLLASTVSAAGPDLFCKTKEKVNLARFSTNLPRNPGYAAARSVAANAVPRQFHKVK